MKPTPTIISSLFLLIALGGTVPPLGADVFSFSGNRVRSIFAKGKERTLLTGNARIRSDANNIRADEIELYGEDLVYAECRGNVRLVNIERGLELTSDRLFYDRTQKTAQVRGNAVMVDRKNEVVVKGGYIENHEEEDITTIQIGVRILKENMSCRSEFATYLRKIDTLELTGMPVVFWKGDQYKAQKIIIDLKKDEVRLEGSVEGEITTEKTDEVPQEGKKPEATAPPSPEEKKPEATAAPPAEVKP
jgi:lipopolysaccharide export system protein LptA